MTHLDVHSLFFMQLQHPAPQFGGVSSEGGASYRLIIIGSFTIQNRKWQIFYFRIKVKEEAGRLSASGFSRQTIQDSCSLLLILKVRKRLLSLSKKHPGSSLNWYSLTDRAPVVCVRMGQTVGSIACFFFSLHEIKLHAYEHIGEFDF